MSGLCCCEGPLEVLSRVISMIRLCCGGRSVGCVAAFCCEVISLKELAELEEGRSKELS
jgi:hypothetical protein